MKSSKFKYEIYMLCKYICNLNFEKNLLKVYIHIVCKDNLNK